MDEKKKVESEQEKASVELRGVCKEYKVDEGVFYALNDVNLSLPSRGMIAVLGPSGCGKTTLLNIVGGLDHQSKGDVFVDGTSTSLFKDKDWDGYRCSKVGFVFQSYNLIHYRNVIHNVELPLLLAGVKKAERKERAKSALEKVGLGNCAKKKVNQLSGGQIQRIAIARAIVNEPSIVLADEPTGALDSYSSKVVFDVLKKIGEERLVVFVTHNEELASNYADRVVRMKDGQIVSDEIIHPLPSPGIASPKKEMKAKRNLSSASVLASCAENLAHKKTRTILTAISCSFGILGIALVLALNNGFSSYVETVEKSVANTVPIALYPTTINTHYESSTAYTEYPSDQKVNVYETRKKSFSEVIYNNFTDDYFSYLDAMMDDSNCDAYGAAMSVMYYRKSLSYHFLKKDPSGTIRQVEQNAGANTSNTLASYTSAPSTILHEIYGDEKNMSVLYDTIEGKYPTEKNELALILDSYNRIDFSTMKALGFYEEDATLNENNQTISFSDIINTEYKCYSHAGYYGVSTEKELEAITEEVTWPGYSSLSVTIEDEDKDKTYEAKVIDNAPDKHAKTMKVITPPDPDEVYADDEKHKPVTCKIVGILRPRKGSYIQLMPSSIAYTPALSEYMVEAQRSEVSQKLGEYQKNDFLIPCGDCLDENGNSKFGFDGKERLQKAFDYLASAYSKLQNGSDFNDVSGDLSNFKDHLSSAFCFFFVNGHQKSGSYTYSNSVSVYLGRCKNYGASFNNIDVKALVTEASLGGFNLLGPSFFDGSSNGSVIDWLSSLNAYALVDSILIFPSSLQNKSKITNYLDAWNDTHPEEKNEYIDVMGDFTSQIATLIKLISIALIILASVALLVSCIMTAIITYVSVVERTKEIGILRSCGAKKFDIARLFESECLFIGLVAGVLGVVLTLLASYPINIVLNRMFPSNNLGQVAKLNPLHAVLLIIGSVLLSTLSGLFPSQIAARKDPVICLRNE